MNKKEVEKKIERKLKKKAEEDRKARREEERLEAIRNRKRRIILEGICPSCGDDLKRIKLGILDSLVNAFNLNEISKFICGTCGERFKAVEKGYYK
jgi:hypothetical protein